MEIPVKLEMAISIYKRFTLLKLEGALYDNFRNKRKKDPEFSEFLHELPAALSLMVYDKDSFDTVLSFSGKEVKCLHWMSEMIRINQEDTK